MMALILATESARQAILAAAEKLGEARDAEMSGNLDVAMAINDLAIALYALACRTDDRYEFPSVV